VTITSLTRSARPRAARLVAARLRRRRSLGRRRARRRGRRPGRRRARSSVAAIRARKRVGQLARGDAARVRTRAPALGERGRLAHRALLRGSPPAPRSSRRATAAPPARPRPAAAAADVLAQRASSPPRGSWVDAGGVHLAQHRNVFEDRAELARMRSRCLVVRRGLAAARGARSPRPRAPDRVSSATANALPTQRQRLRRTARCGRPCARLRARRRCAGIVGDPAGGDLIVLGRDKRRDQLAVMAADRDRGAARFARNGMNERTPSRTVLMSSSITCCRRHRRSRRRSRSRARTARAAVAASALSASARRRGQSVGGAVRGEPRDLAPEDPAQLQQIADQLRVIASRASGSRCWTSSMPPVSMKF
jgi:hypothetical protein